MSTERPEHVSDDLVWQQIIGTPRPAPALFLDRDGVVVAEAHHLRDPAKVRLIAGAAEVIGRANARGVHVVIVTNQSGIGRGIFDWPDFAAVQARILAELSDLGARVDAVLACPFHADVDPPYRHPDHPDRKPNPGMLLRAAAQLRIDLERSWIIGDRPVDIEAGRRAGLAGALHVLTGCGPAHRDAAVKLANETYAVTTVHSVAAAPSLLPFLRD